MRRLFVNRKKLYIVVNSVSIDSLITNAARSIDVPLVKPNSNDDCCDGSRCSIRLSIRDRPFNLKWGGGGVWFFVSFRMFYSNNTRVSIFIFFVAQSAIFFQNSTLGYMTKTLNHIFFVSTKIRIFFSATLGIRIAIIRQSDSPTVR